MWQAARRPCSLEVAASAGKPDHVSSGIDAGDGRPQLIVDLQQAACVRLDPDRFQTKSRRSSLAAHGEQHRLGDDLLARLESDQGRTARRRDRLDRFDRLSAAERHQLLPHLTRQLVDDLAVEERQRTAATIDHGDADTERREHARVLDADHTGTDHRETARQLR